MHMCRYVKRTAIAVCILATALGAAGCSKKKSGPSGSWLVGESGLMTNLLDDGSLGEGYDLKSDHDLLDIACRGAETAFVVGEEGTLLRTFDGGASWEQIDLNTTRTLRSVATAGPDVVYVAGDAALKRSSDSGATWTDLDAAGNSAWLAVSGDHDGNAFALTADGTIYGYALGKAPVREASLAGARALASSHDGVHVAAVGPGRTLLRTDDGGEEWRSIDLGRDLELRGVWVTGYGDVLAVGDGAIVRVTQLGAVTIAEPTAATLRSLHIDDGGHGLAVGDQGTVLATHDGGGSWAKLDLGLTGTVFGVDDVDGEGHY